MYKSSPHFRHQRFTNVQWNGVTQNPSLYLVGEHGTTEPVAQIRTSQMAKAINAPFLDNDAAKQ